LSNPTDSINTSERKVLGSSPKKNLDGGTKMGERDRLVLDKDLAQQESRVGIGTNPVDIDEASQFTLEAELIRLSSLLKEKGQSGRNQRITNNEIKRRMKQAEEDRDKLSERGIAAFDYLQSTKEIWDGGIVMEGL
jgi:hypothetical protein